MSQLICQCGGVVPRPLPPTCPHCDRVITGVRRPRGAFLWPIVVVTSFFALLILGLVMLLQWFGAGKP